QYRCTPYAQDLAAAFTKLTAALPDEVTLKLDHLQDAYSFRTLPVTPADADVFARMAQAVRDQRRLEILYWSASRDCDTRRRVDPYHLACLSGDWYLVAYCHLRKDVRMFVPSRIHSLALTADTF